MNQWMDDLTVGWMDAYVWSSELGLLHFQVH